MARTVGLRQTVGRLPGRCCSSKLTKHQPRLRISSVVKRITSLLLIAISTCLVALSHCHAEDRLKNLAIIVSNTETKPAIFRRNLESIYRRQLLFDRNNKIVIPINLPPMHPLREAFSLRIFNEKPQNMQAYWNEQYFHGTSPPHVVASPEAMKRFVEVTPGAVGYVLQCQVDRRVRVLWTMKIEIQDEMLDILCSK